MNFDALKEELKTLTFDSLRRDEEIYFEAVILKPELEKMSAALEKFLGPPVWNSAKEKLTAEMSEAINDFGGVAAGQTLYFLSDGKVRIFAMIWPWQDHEHITLKTGRK
ncbi:MAG: hypothetical protein PHC33_00415 [Candidatus Omnitrophica bacterium]|nr:hypothetical protein [Candidatus Omnitrophota bacterium]